MKEAGPDAAGTRYEVEIKYRAVDHGLLRGRLEALGARFESEERERDTYLSHPARDFGKTGEVFRIRQVGERVHLTYKGPKLAGPAKTREEIEVACGASLAEVETLCQRLGFAAVRSVCKNRATYALRAADRQVLVVLDEVEGLGSFAEVEALAAGAGDLEEAQRAVGELAARLGLTEIEPRSYLRMVLEGG